MLSFKLLFFISIFPRTLLIFYYFVHDDCVVSLFEKWKTLFDEGGSDQQIAASQNKFSEANLFLFLVLLLEFSELLLISVKNNGPNHFYNSQLKHIDI